MKSGAVLVSGYASFDSFLVVDRFYGKGKTSTVVTIEGLEQPYPGGCACNIAVACARLGIRPILVTVLGDDDVGNSYISFLNKIGVDTRLVYLAKKSPSPRTILINDKNGSSVTLYYPGPSDEAAQELRTQLDVIKKYEIAWAVITVGNSDITNKTIDILSLLRVPILWSFKSDMRAYPPAMLQKLIRVSAYLILNEGEFRLLRKILDYHTDDFWKQGLKGIIVTRGAKGCKIVTEDKQLFVPSVKPSKVMDTTGAGDGFVAGVLYGLYHGLDLPQAARIGTVLASFVVEMWGAQSALPDLEKLKARYLENFGTWPI